jgi:hypothetical protein
LVDVAVSQASTRLGMGVGREGSEATTIEEVAAAAEWPGTFFRYLLAKEEVVFWS